jgi:molybdopterin-containing oxidoreductase family membrane subunit
MSLALVAGFADEQLQNWLKLALWLGLVLVVVEVLTSLVGGGAEVGMILAGFAAPAFWWQVIVGLLVPIVLLVRKSYVWLAGVLAISGVVAEKVWTLAAGQAKPWLALPEGVYFPSWIELIAVIGLAALGILIYRLLILIFKPE